MKQRVIILRLMFLPLIMLLFGCEKKIMPEDDIMKKTLTAEYKLVSVYWSGLAKDLNEDGLSYWELSVEFEKMMGFYEPDYFLRVTDGNLSRSEVQYAFNFSVPYPVFMADDEGIFHYTEIRTFKQTIYTEKNQHRRIIPIHTDMEDNFLSRIEEIEVYRPEQGEEDEVDLTVLCSLPDGSGEQQTMDHNCLHYTFKRID